MKARYADRRGQVDTWYICSRAYESRAEPHCQSIAGWPVDEAIGELIAAEMTPAAVELAWEVRKEIEARHDEVDQLRRRAIERAQMDAELAQRRFMLVEPHNRLVADTLESEWNDKLRMLADLQEERGRALREDQLMLDDAIHDRLTAMTSDFKVVWCDPALPNRERKRLLAYLVEDVTLLKFPAEGETRIHIRFRGGRTETLTVQNPKSSAQQVKTRPEVVELVDKLLDDHICAEIADILNEQGIRPGGSARRGQVNAKFTDLRVIYLVKRYGLRPRYDRLRERGMLTKAEACAKLGITECTLVRWAKYGIVKRHAANGYIGLYEPPGPHVPTKQCSRWNQLVHRAETLRQLTGLK